MFKPLLLSLTVLLSAAGPLPATPLTVSAATAGGRGVQQSAEVERLVREIEASRGEVQRGLLGELVGLGSAESLVALKGLCAELDEVGSLRNAFGAFAGYLGQEPLEAEAVAFVSRACEDELVPRRRAAAAGLARLAPAAMVELERLSERGADEVVRALALGPLLPELERAGTPAAAARILLRARVPHSGSRDRLRASLASFTGEANDLALLASLADRQLPGENRALAAELLAPRDVPGLEKALRTALKDRSPELVLAALAALESRGSSDHGGALKALLKSRDESVRRQAVISLGRLRGGDERWERQLGRLAKDRDPATRMGAAVALADLRTDGALESLHGLVVDEDHLVQREALQQLANLRRAESLPLLIARIEEVRGLTLRQLLWTLRMITGLDHGTSHTRWDRWWQAEGAGFELPTTEEAQRAEDARVERRAGSETVSTFYGLRVVSDRVCFILDVSRSMLQESSEGNRLDVAKAQLEGVLKGFPAGDLFNVIFFSSQIAPWSDALVEMSARRRAEALAFVAEQKPSGVTAIYDALAVAFEDRRIDTIYLLTDGDPKGGSVDDVEEIRAEVARWNRLRRIHIHCVAIGQSSVLLEQLAADSGGEYREER